MIGATAGQFSNSGVGSLSDWVHLDPPGITIPYDDLSSVAEIAQAQQLLCNTSCPLGVIAAEVGYEGGQESFNRGFKARLGVTPQQYREAIWEKTGRRPFSVLRTEWDLYGRAQDLLYDPNLTVVEISKELQFSSPKSFGLFYKRLSRGLMPSEGREQLWEKRGKPDIAPKVFSRDLLQKVERSKVLLKETIESFDCIANEIDFDDARQFSREFKKVVGISPLDYRKKYRDGRRVYSRQEEVVQKLNNGMKLLLACPEMSVDEVAKKCGYYGKGALHNALKSNFGVTPSELRQETSSLLDLVVGTPS